MFGASPVRVIGQNVIGQNSQTSGGLTGQVCCGMGLSPR